MRPVVKNIRKRRQSISVFRGINRSVNTAMSKLSYSNSNIYMEFKNTKNVTLDDYPAVRTRDKRLYIHDSAGIISNILATDEGIVRLKKNGSLYIGDTALVIDMDMEDGEHQLIEYGNSVVILPEKYLVRLSDLKVSQMENYFESKSSDEAAELTKMTLQKVSYNTSITPSSTRYEQKLGAMFADVTDPVNQNQDKEIDHSLGEWFGQFELGDVLEDVSSEPTSLYMVTEIKTDVKYANYFNSKLVVFTQINDTYTKISREGIGKGFAVGDWIRLEVEGIEELNSSFKILELSDNYIVINHEIEKSQDFIGKINVSRQLPVDMDFMVSCNNRLWGCSSKSNTVYACRLGDPTNWEAYGDGIASDSYWAELSSEGEFTGITASGSSVYFFKENCIHRIYGTKPSNFALSTFLDQGVKKGSEKSIVWLKDRLFYLAPSGVCVYSPGDEPTVISEEAFGNTRYIASTAGKHGTKYVISLKREDGEWELFVYDTENGQWVLENNEWFSSTTSYRDVLYFRLGDTNYLGCMSDPADCLLRFEKSKELLTEGEIEWELESGDLYDMYAEHKYIQKVELILENEDGEVTLWLSRDGKPFEKVNTQYATIKRSITIPLHPGRCSNFKIKLTGRGKFYLYGVTLTTEEGSSTNGKLQF